MICDGAPDLIYIDIYRYIYPKNPTDCDMQWVSGPEIYTFWLIKPSGSVYYGKHCVLMLIEVKRKKGKLGILLIISIIKSYNGNEDVIGGFGG